MAGPVLVLADGVCCPPAACRLALPARSGFRDGEEQSGQAAAPGAFPPAGARGGLGRGEAAALRAAAAAQVHGLPADLRPQRRPLVPELHQDRLPAGAPPESGADSREGSGSGGAGGRQSPGARGGSGTRGRQSLGAGNGGTGGCENPRARGGRGAVRGYGRAAVACLRCPPAGELLPEQEATVPLPRSGSHARPIPYAARLHSRRFPVWSQPTAGCLLPWCGMGMGGRGSGSPWVVGLVCEHGRSVAGVAELFRPLLVINLVSIVPCGASGL